MDWLTTQDVSAFRLIHVDGRLPWLDPVMLVVTNTGLGNIQLAPILVAWAAQSRPKFAKGLAVLLALLAIVVVVLDGTDDGVLGWHFAALVACTIMFWRISAKDARRAALAFVLAGIGNLAIRVFIDRMRPSNFAWAEPLEAIYKSPSFPSGHTVTSTAIGFSLLLASRGAWWGWAAALWGLAVGYSRIYVGVHFPTDVVAGTALGLLGASLAYQILNQPQRGGEQNRKK